ncbi:ABC transporter substrate-binding protein [Nonomuraea sp. NPDC051191]|uniref:ABC transporter substrate-binding protein n=1 Tax=Nonomuraea sp. NPDC051191 TaxID=3364372 RepID=UPI0037A1127B
MRRALIILAAVLVTACGGTQPGTRTEGKDEVNAGVIAIVDTAPIHLARSKGFFAEQGIDLTIPPVQGGAAGISGAVGGQFQFAFANTTSLLTAKQQGLDVKVVANGVSSTGRQGEDFSAVLVEPGSPIRSASSSSSCPSPTRPRP